MNFSNLDSEMLFELLIDSDSELSIDNFDNDANISQTQLNEFRAQIKTLKSNPHMRDELTELLLNFSICPIHFCDYAICFDDNDPECSQIRMIHPSHDT